MERETEKVKSKICPEDVNEKFHASDPISVSGNDIQKLSNSCSNKTLPWVPLFRISNILMKVLKFVIVVRAPVCVFVECGCFFEFIEYLITEAVWQCWLTSIWQMFQAFITGSLPFSVEIVTVTRDIQTSGYITGAQFSSGEVSKDCVQKVKILQTGREGVPSLWLRLISITLGSRNLIHRGVSGGGKTKANIWRRQTGIFLILILSDFTKTVWDYSARLWSLEDHKVYLLKDKKPIWGAKFVLKINFGFYAPAFSLKLARRRLFCWPSSDLCRLICWIILLLCSPSSDLLRLKFALPFFSKFCIFCTFFPWDFSSIFNSIPVVEWGELPMFVSSLFRTSAVLKSLFYC